MAETNHSGTPGSALADVAPRREHDDTAWLTRYSAQEWIQCALKELSLAQQAFNNRMAASAAAALKRAAGMALNGALRVVPRDDWGRSYVEHLQALTKDASVPPVVAEAARALLEFAPQPGNVVLLRSPARDERLLEAARTVMAHAYAIVNGSTGRLPDQH
jgi:HEPN domain-containing protein